jgi:lactate permease
MIDLAVAAFPIALLVWLMTKARPMPSTFAFALAAALTYAARAFYFQSPINLLNASILTGLLNALTPISIVFGAILFFVAMERSGAMGRLQEWLRDISPNPVAQLMIVGWSFQFLIEGASGFGTPAALAAPVLVGLGFPPLRVAILCLAMNSVPVSFGAVGTPTWFGFGGLPLTDSDLLALGVKTAILQWAAGMVVPIIALRFVVGWRDIRENIGFIYLSILFNTVPMVAIATFNDEFPSVIGGAIGLVATILLARFQIGLKRTPSPQPHSPLATRSVMLALSPLIATIVILLVTRIPILGLRQWLTAAEPNIAFPLGAIGEFSASATLVLQLRNVLGEGLNWSHAVLYVPSIIPFVLTAGAALTIFHNGREAGAVLNETGKKIVRPVVALFGALVFVQLLMAGGESASTMILGRAFADMSGEYWKYLAPLLGALGSFFAGSATISNLTFGGIQLAIANETGLEPSTVLALQSGGAAMGNMICIHNIIAVCAVLGLANREGWILKRTIIPMIAYWIVFALVAAVFLQ